MSKLNVFISYAHKDADYFAVFKEGLKSHLYTSSRFDFGTWDDSKIYVGSFWDNEIKQNLQTAGIAVLCVSSNFLNSKYIKEEEFNKLKANNKDTLIIPVYFNHCNFEAWMGLSSTQFFKPEGSNYGKPNSEDFAFCDLVKFSETNKELIPNSNIDLYILDLTRQIEAALQKNRGDNISTPGTFQNEIISGQRSIYPVIKEGGSINLDKVVTLIIIAAIGLSLVLLLFFLFNSSEVDHFKINVSLAMFFGSIASFMFNKKNTQLNRR